VTETSVGNKMGTQYQAGQAAETQISGITYSNSLPKYSDFVKILKDKNTILVKKQVLYNSSTSVTAYEIKNKPTPISNTQEKGSFIYATATIKDAYSNEFRVTYFDANKIILMEDHKGEIWNYTIQIE